VTLKEAPYALRVTRRDGAEVVHVYRREPDANHRDRLQRLVTLGPLARQAGEALLRRAVDGAPDPTLPAGRRRARRAAGPAPWPMPVGPFRAVSAEWGARVALYALVTRGIRDATRLPLAARHVVEMSGTDATWWVGLTTGARAERGIRALRILTDAVA
jgi:hypothetical protein